MAETVDDFKLLYGYKNNVPTLADRRILLVEDDGTGRLVVGTQNGNMNVPNEQDLVTLQQQVDEANTSSTTASTNANEALTKADTASLSAQSIENTVNNLIKKISEAPVGSADFIGQFYIDTTNLIAYIAVQTGTGVSDWKQITN